MNAGNPRWPKEAHISRVRGGEADHVGSRAAVEGIEEVEGRHGLNPRATCARARGSERGMDAIALAGAAASAINPSGVLLAPTPVRKAREEHIFIVTALQRTIDAAGKRGGDGSTMVVQDRSSERV